jgi:predicted PurR-regulated permease PerM
MVISPLNKMLFWVGALALVLGFVWLFKGILTPFVLGVLIAYLLEPVMRRFSHRKIPRWISSITILAVFFLIVILVLLAILPMATRQLESLVQDLPLYAEKLMLLINPYLMMVEGRFGVDVIDQMTVHLKEHAGKLVGMTGDILGGLMSGGAALIGFFTTFFFTPIVAFFMMQEWPSIVRWVNGLYPRQHETTIRTLLSRMDKKVAGFIRGQTLVALLLGTLYAIALTLAGLKYGFLIGLFAGVFTIIPLVGSTLGLVVGVLVAWFQTGEIGYTALIAGIFMAGQFLEGNFISPKLLGDSVGLHPLWIMFALLAGGSLFGIVGMLLAVPLTAVFGVLAGFALDMYKTSPYYTNMPAKAAPTDSGHAKKPDQA